MLLHSRHGISHCIIEKEKNAPMGFIFVSKNDSTHMCRRIICSVETFVVFVLREAVRHSHFSHASAGIQSIVDIVLLVNLHVKSQEHKKTQ